MEFLLNIEKILISASNGVDVPVESVKFMFVKTTALWQLNSEDFHPANAFNAIPAAKVGMDSLMLMLYHTITRHLASGASASQGNRKPGSDRKADKIT